MVAKCFLVALSCVLTLQIHQVRCDGPPEQAGGKFGHEVAHHSITTMLQHIRIILTHPESAARVRHIAESIAAVLTDPVGQENAQALMDFIVGLLMDENTFNTADTFHRRLVDLAESDRSAPLLLETAAMYTKKIVDQPKLMEATEGFVKGLDIMLDGVNEDKLREMIARVKSLQRLAFVFKPIVKRMVPVPKKLDKAKKAQSKSQPRSSAYRYNSEGQSSQSRDPAWIDEQPRESVRTINIDISS